MRSRTGRARSPQRNNSSAKHPRQIDTEGKTVQSVNLSRDLRYVTYTLFEVNSDERARSTEMPRYVTNSGYTEIQTTRSKVGGPSSYRNSLMIYDTEADSIYSFRTDKIPGIRDLPGYVKDYPNRKNIIPEERIVSVSGINWSEDGKFPVVNITSADNKDRWIMLLDLKTGIPESLDRQRDEAWIGGPGTRNIGWMPDNERIWFQSEESGYSHLYTLNVVTKEKKALTSGKFEVFGPRMSKDKKFWYFSSSQVHPGERHFYKMPINGGQPEQITSMEGSNQVYMSPDEKNLAIIYSYSNKPAELYLMKNKAGETARKITSSLTEEFKAYNWRAPEVLSFKAEDGVDVYARLYRPEKPEINGPAVVFVHGAGYLQNAHKWWSTYYHEYMFHNFLVDNGFTVLDIDYRGSAGYGRDCRTGIYRHMGGKDLSDQVDGVKMLVEKYNVDPKRVGLYGGSYGGFITLMAMFNEPDVFTAGAALRSVTDWAHYNHGYTANILNTPVEDSIAYARSSPIYFAEGLKGHLVMLHGMEDSNVHFQDVVRLSQRLIELGKDNWELSVFPLEGHGFTRPTSWTDEYKRIYKLFETTLK
jgi:dipeptidyl aminopeptidase/acylaminoacyl peptidase